MWDGQHDLVPVVSAISHGQELQILACIQGNTRSSGTRMNRGR
jgi:hypothetical protein